MEDFAKSLNDLITTNLPGFGIVLLYAIIALVISFPLKWAVRKLPCKWGKSLAGPLGDLLQIILVAVGIFFGARSAGVDVTVLLAVVAILTAGLSLALDSNVKDAIASAKILSSNLYKVGESISFDAITGKVYHLSLFSTTIHVSDRGLVTIANSKVVDGPVTNHSREPVEMQIRVPILSECKRSWVLSHLTGEAGKNNGVVSCKVIHVWEPGGSEIYTIFAKVKDYDKRREIATEVSIAISDFLEESGLKLGEVSLRKQI